MVASKQVQSFIEFNQGQLFSLALSKGLDIFVFIKEYMHSDICRRIDSYYSYWQSQSPETVLEALIINKEISAKKNEKQNINKDAVEWLGYFYRKWHYITGESSKSIYKFLNPKEGIKSWYTYHQLDENEVIYMAKTKYNSKRNAHRRGEIKYQKENQKQLEDILSGFVDNTENNPIYYALLAKRILYKLYREPVYKVLEYCPSDDFDLIDENHRLAIKANKISYSQESFINDIESMVTNKGHYNPNEYDKSFMFIFVTFKNNDDYSNDFLNSVNNYIYQFSPSMRRYHSIYFYYDNHVVEINDKNEIRNSYLPISLNDRVGILSQVKKITKHVQSLDSMTDDEFDEMMEQSLNQAKNGESVPMDEVLSEIKKDLK